MYSVSKRGDTFRVQQDGTLVIEIAPGIGTVHELFSELYSRELAPCDTAFDLWLDDGTSRGELVAMLRSNVRKLRPDELVVDYTTNPYADKPPVGLTPRSIWLTSCYESRMTAITQAVQRYMTANLPVPQDWLDEYNELCTQLKGS